jgi:hypothetical protein
VNVTCAACGTAFDDADQSTLCPHRLIMAPEDLERKKAALAMPRRVCFAHMPRGPVLHVTAIGWNGMVRLAEMVGEFAPHLFVEPQEKDR